MTTESGTWMRAQREERGWSRSHLARQLITAARDAGDEAMPAVDTLRKNISRWENDEVDISDRYRLLYCRLLGIKPAYFGPQSEPRVADTTVIQPAAVIPVGPGSGVPRDDPLAYRWIEAPQYQQPAVRQEVLMAAHEGSDHATRAEAHGIGEATVEQLRADVIRLSRQSDIGEPLAVFVDLRRVRGRIYQLLERRLWPGEQSDLYFLLGILNGLMGVAADRLGYPDSAEELMRAG